MTRHGPAAAPSALPLLVLLALSAPPALALAHVLNHVTLQHRLLDLRLENTVPTWASGALLLGAAVLALTAGRAATGRRTRLAWLSLAALGGAMSLDEVASVHEVAGSTIGAEATLSASQPLAAVVVVAMLVTTAHLTRGRAAQWLLVAVTLLVVSQTSASVGGLLLGGGATHVAEVVEETTEMAFAVALLAAGVAGSGVRLLGVEGAVRAATAWWRRPAAAPAGADLP